MTRSIRIMLVATSLITAPAHAQTYVQPPGRLVDIGGYHIHLWCTGRATPTQPTVLLSAGGGGFALDWSLVQPSIADSSRVCSYDRANFGWSDLGPSPRTMRQEVFELRAALHGAGEAPPFVFVGHSMGGLVARLFTERYPEQVVGMVLVDPAHESGRYGYRGELVQVRTLASERPVPEPAALHERPPQFAIGDAAQRCRSVAASATVFGPYLKLPSREQQSLLWLLRNPKCYVTGDDYLPEEFASMHEKRLRTPYPLESMPLVVIARMRSSPPPGVDRNEWEREKLAHKHDLATLSMQGRVVTDSLSGHHIHIDNPGLVVNTIRDMVRRVRGH